MATEQYDVKGMSCAACSARVEKAVSKLDGVDECAVSLLTNSMSVTGTATPDSVISAVKAAGYKASLKRPTQEKGKQSDKNSEAQPKSETRTIIKRLVASSVFLLLLMYISMGHTMWGFPLPRAVADDAVALGIAELLLATAVMVINQKFFINGFGGLIKRAPNMDTLVALGSAAAYIYSLCILFSMSALQKAGDLEGAMHRLHGLYFESAAMILALITVGKMLESYSKGRTTDAIKGLLKLAPKTANVIRDGKEVTISADDMVVGDIFVIRPGESIPADGIVTEGESAVNESALTGESVPADKSVGSTLYASTINTSGILHCKAEKVGSDTALAKIIKMVSDASASKAPIAKAADRISGIFVPAVIAIAVITAAGWLIANESIGFALARGISVLVISCPCALGLATPVAIMVGSGVGAKNGILFKNAAALETAGHTNIVALDKTGTITMGKPKVTDIVPAVGVTKEELITAAYSIEKNSEHPLAAAIVEYSAKREFEFFSLGSFKALAGSGVYGVFGENEFFGGSIAFIKTKADIEKDMLTTAEELAKSGKTPTAFCKNGKFLGIIAVADTVKPDSKKAVEDLRKMGIRVIMLTGDNRETASAIAKEVGDIEIVAEVMPDGKEKEIRRLMESGKVAMVGDGINDAPALTSADTGIAIGAGADIAIDAANVVLTNSSLSDAVSAFKLSRATLRNIYENLFWAFCYNIIGIPLAAGAFIPLWGWELDPMFAAAAMSFSSFFVVANALRLNLVKLGNKK